MSYPGVEKEEGKALKTGEGRVVAVGRLWTVGCRALLDCNAEVNKRRVYNQLQK